MSDVTITRNGVTKVIDDSDAGLVDAAKAKGWSFEAPAEAVQDDVRMPADGGFVRMKHADGRVKDVSPDLLETARAKGWAEDTGEAAPVSPAPAVPAHDEPGIGQQIWEGVKGIPAAAQTLAESALPTFAAAGAEAAPNYLADLVTPGKTADFTRSYDEAKQGIAGRAEQFAPTAAIGHAAGDAALMLGTGGLGGTALGAKAAAYVPKIGAAGKFLTSLGVEGATQGAALSAANELDDMLASGNHKAVAERLSAVAMGGVIGGATNIAAGGIFGGLSKLVTSARKGAEDLSGKLAFKAVMGRTDAPALERLGGAEAAERLGNEALDRGLIHATDKVSDIAKRATAQRQTIGQELGAARQELGELAGLGVSAQPQRRDLYSAIDREVIEPLRQNPISKPTARAVETRLADLKEWAEAGGDVSFNEINEMRRVLDQELHPERGMKSNATTEHMEKVRRVMEDYYMTSADQVADKFQALAPELTGRIRQLKRDYGAVAEISKQAKKGTERQLANNAIGVRDALAGATVAAGALQQGSISGLAAAAATTLASKIVRERGEAFGAVMLRGAVKQTEAIGRAATNLVAQRAVRQGAVAAIEDVTAHHAPIMSFVKTATALADPQSHESQALGMQAQEVANELGPDTAKAYEAQQREKAAYVMDKVPVIPGSAFTEEQHDLSPPVLDQLKPTFDAVNDPHGAIERLGNGTYTPEDRETLEDLYPDMLREFEEKTISQLHKMKDADIDTQMRISAALGKPLAGPLADGSVAFWQEVSLPDPATTGDVAQSANVAPQGSLPTLG